MKSLSSILKSGVLIKMMARTLVVLSLSILLVEYMAYHKSSEEITRLTIDRQQSLTALHAERFDRTLLDIAADLNTICDLPSLQDYYFNRQYDLLNEADQQLARVADFLFKLTRYKQAYASIVVEDAGHETVLSIRNGKPDFSRTLTAIGPAKSLSLPGEPIVPAKQAESIFDEGIKWDEVYNDVLSFSKDVTFSGHQWGRVRILYRLDALTRALEQERIFDTGRLAIYGKGGRIIHDPAFPKATSVADIRPTLFRPISKHASGTYEVDEKDNGLYLLTFSPMRQKNWVIAAIAPKNEMLAGLNRTKTLVIELIVLNIVIEFVFIFFFAKRLIIRPIKKLLAGTREVVSGNYSVQVNIASRDEFGELAHAFNSMTASLKEHVRSIQAHEVRLRQTQEILQQNVERLEQEVDERKRITEALKDQNELLETMIEAIPAPIFYKDVNGVYLGCNQAFGDIVGFRKNEVIGKTARDIAPGDLARIYEDADRKLVESGGKSVYEAKALVSGGSVRYFLFHKAVFFRGDRSMGGLVAVMLDITQRKKAQEELLHSYDLQSSINQLLTLSMENLPLPVMLDKVLEKVTSVPWLKLEKKGILLFADEEGETLRVEHQWNMDPEAVERCAQVETAQCLGKKPVKDREIIFKNGPDRSNGLASFGTGEHGHYCVPVLSSGGGFLGVLGLFAGDDSMQDDKAAEFLGAASHILSGIIEKKIAEEERRNLEEQLLQAQKMEAVGALASGIAHDFNNLLQAITGYTWLLLSDCDKDDPHREQLSHIEHAARRASELVKNLLTFSRKERPALAPMNLNREAAQAISLLERTIPKMVRVSTRLAEDLAPINGDAAQLEQVIMNLGTNARDAMADGGTLTIETGNVFLDEKFCNTHLIAGPGEFVRLRFEDTGAGMDDDTRKRIFDPFFTTKGVGEGTGLGLSTVYGIIRNHGGYIICDSSPGEGTRFDIYLPVARAERKDPIDIFENEALITGGEETILLVDDEQIILELAQTILERYGYKVKTAMSGEQAIDLYRSDPRAYNLIIMDLGMPGMGGRRCLETLVHFDPNVKIIIASGYAMEDQGKGIFKSGAKGYIRKPYHLDELTMTVRSVLDET